jgi:hypothetical protein
MRGDYFQSKPWQGGPAAVPITRLVSSGAEYTPLRDECQYLVAIFFFNAIECAYSAETLRTKVLKFRGLSGRSGGVGGDTTPNSREFVISFMDIFQGGRIQCERFLIGNPMIRL